MKRVFIKQSILTVMLLAASQVHAFDAKSLSYKLSLKQPGNKAVTYQLTRNGQNLSASAELPVAVSEKLVPEGKDLRIVVTHKIPQLIQMFNQKIKYGFVKLRCWGIPI